MYAAFLFSYAISVLKRLKELNITFNLMLKITNNVNFEYNFIKSTFVSDLIKIL